MNWVLIGVLVWFVVALLAALVIGSAIRSAEQTHDADDARTLAGLQGDERIVGSDVPAPEVPVPKKVDLPYTGPETRPFPPPPSVPRQRRGVLPFHGTPSRREPSRDPSQRDYGVL